MGLLVVVPGLRIPDLEEIDRPDYYALLGEVGVAAVVATMHDILITLGFLALLRTDISLGTVAALLTIVGYSLNDTVVVFDRIREELATWSPRKEPYIDVLDRSIIAQDSPLAPWIVLLVIAGVVRFGGAYVRRFRAGRVSLDVQNDLRTAVYDNLQRLDFARHDELRTGQLVSRATSDIGMVQGLLAFLPIVLANVLFFLVAPACGAGGGGLADLALIVGDAAAAAAGLDLDLAGEGGLAARAVDGALVQVVKAGAAIGADPLHSSCIGG